MINLMKFVEILETYNLVPNALVDSKYSVERENGMWGIRYETERGTFRAFETQLGSLKVVYPIRVYGGDTSLQLMLNILELNGFVEGSITKTNVDNLTVLNYEREIPPHRLTDAAQDICQIFKIIEKDISLIRHLLYDTDEIDGMETMVERLEKTWKDNDEN